MIGFSTLTLYFCFDVAGKEGKKKQEIVSKN